MKSMWKAGIGLAIGVAFIASSGRAEVIEFEDKDEWIDAVGDFTTIDFTGFDECTVITDQYANLGILFTDGNDLIDSGGSYLNDGWGLYGGWYDDIELAFDEAQAWIAVDYPGSVQFDLYNGNELIHSAAFYTSGAGNFAGLTSTVLFDNVVVSRPTGGGPFIDDLHFGVPGPSALAAFALFGAWRRGKRRES